MQKSNWQEEFDKEFDVKIVPLIQPVRPILNCPDAEAVKSFIENLLEQERKRMSEEIEKMKKTRFIGDTKSPTEDTEWISRNQALDEVLSIINN